MKTNTKSQIIEFIKKNGQASPKQIVDFMNLSPQIIHRHLKELLLEKQILKIGKSPKVYYRINSKIEFKSSIELKKPDLDFFERNYLYINPQGQLLVGFEGFKAWAQTTKQSHQLALLSSEYLEIRRNYDKFLDSHLQLIEATEKFNTTFQNNHLDSVYYSDFYSLPKFGKTRLGNLVLYAKQAQSIKLIKEIASLCSASLNNLIKDKKIDSVVWTPHSLPRKIQFLSQLKKNLTLNLPVIQFDKAYMGEIPIAQKSLSKLDERIENAENTIFAVEKKLSYKRILVIDDAVGSGATLHAIAGKLKKLNPKAIVTGYAVVGNLKGFEIIKEV